MNKPFPMLPAKTGPSESGRVPAHVSQKESSLQTVRADRQQPAPDHHGGISGRGFTLVEVIVSLLIMGMAAGGLFQICDMGSRHYRSITDSAWEQDTLVAVRREIRRQVTTGHPEQLTRESLARFLPTGSHLMIAEFSVNQYPQGAYFLRVRVFSDRNRNGRAEPQELLPPWTLCFRKR